MRSYDCHVKHPPLRHLEPVLKKWHDLNVEYCDEHEDVIYWYTERSNVGALAAAVWKSGSQALEEFSAIRGFGRDQREGRADLWFKWGRTDYVAEAKRIWVCLSPRAKDPAPKIAEALKDARDAAVDSRYEGEKRLGIVFAVPYIAERYADQCRPLVDAFLTRLAEAVDYGIMCSVFPPSARKLRGWEGRMYPGVVLLARMPRRKY